MTPGLRRYIPKYLLEIKENGLQTPFVAALNPDEQSHKSGMEADCRTHYMFVWPPRISSLKDGLINANCAATSASYCARWPISASVGVAYSVSAASRDQTFTASA